MADWRHISTLANLGSGAKGKGKINMKGQHSSPWGSRVNPKQKKEVRRGHELPGGPPYLEKGRRNLHQKKKGKGEVHPKGEGGPGLQPAKTSFEPEQYVVDTLNAKPLLC